MTKSETNRMNAQKSTGARTAEGKATVAKNAIKHGIFAKAALLSNENKAEFDALLTDLKTDLQPQGVLQSFLVEKIESRDGSL